MNQPFKHCIANARIAIKSPAIEITRDSVDRSFDFLAISASPLISSFCSLVSSICGSGGILICGIGFISSFTNSALFTYSSAKCFIDSFSGMTTPSLVGCLFESFHSLREAGSHQISKGLIHV